MVESIPTFRLELSEGFHEIEKSADRLFGVCVEATKGPIFEPVFCGTNTEAIRIFGKSFAPHFYQNPTGLVIVRVAAEGATKASKDYLATGATQADITAMLNAYLDAITASDVEDFYDTTKDAVITASKTALRNYVNGLADAQAKQEFLSSQDSVEAKIKEARTYGTEGSEATDVVLGDVELPESDKILMKVESNNVGTSKKVVAVTTSIGVRGGYNVSVNIDGITSKSYQSLPSLESVCKRLNDKFGQYITATFIREPAEGESLADSTSYELTGGSNGKILNEEGEVTTQDIDEGREVATGVIDDPLTAMYAYRKGFEVLTEIDLIGVLGLSELGVVRNELVDHINDMNDPEKAQIRFGITAFLPEDGGPNNIRNSEAIVGPATTIDSEYMLYIGQGVEFEEEGVTRTLSPMECTLLYTGIRSALGYGEAIFGGQPKKVLKGVKNVVPLFNTTEIVTKSDVEFLNESGVMTFKKEYDEITFLEGVTTTQSSQVLSHESIMSIVANVTKRLIKAAKPYQGQNMNEDLKASLTTQLSTVLKNVADTDGTLIEIPEYNIAPYDVTVESAAIAKFNDAGELIRVSKIIIRAKIVPIGALRDIDLGVIII